MKRVVCVRVGESLADRLEEVAHALRHQERPQRRGKILLTSPA